MFPLRDHNPSGRLPIINYLLIAVNVAIFLYMMTLSESGLLEFVESWALIPREISSGVDYQTLITSMFLHGGIAHIFGNMLFLFIFGDNLEDRLGHIKYLIFYILSGIGASLVQIALNPMGQIPNLGASGAIAGVMGGYLVLFPHSKVDVLFPFFGLLRVVALPAYTMLIYWFVIQFFSGVGTIGVPEQGGVAYGAHVGGFVAGLIMIFLLRPFLGPAIQRQKIESFY